MRRLTYREIADDLQERIQNGEYPPGTALPSYSTLASLYTVHISTAAKAVALLRDRGLVEGHAGRGVYVKQP